MPTTAQALAAAATQDKNSNRMGLANAAQLGTYLQTASTDPAQRDKVGIVRATLRRHGYQIDKNFNVTSVR